MMEENALSIDEINTWLEEYRVSVDEKTKKKLKELVVLACMPIVKKVVGFDKGQFYILGDYIYYTTPHNQKDETGD